MSGPISTNLISFGSIKDDTIWGAFASMKLWSKHYASGSELLEMIKVASCGSLDEFGRRMVKSTLEMVESKSNLNQQIEGDVYNTVLSKVGEGNYETIRSWSVSLLPVRSLRSSSKHQQTLGIFRANTSGVLNQFSPESKGSHQP
ncbi:unnamed protein product [Sphagnum balticum]